MTSVIESDVEGSPDSTASVGGLVGVDPKDTIYCVIAPTASNLAVSTGRNNYRIGRDPIAASQ